MIKILSSRQLKELDQATIKIQKITSDQLMERAATLCFRWLAEKYTKDTVFSVICGVGNNGGDGLVIARLLSQSGYKVNCVLLSEHKNFSPDNLINQKRLKEIGNTIIKIDVEKQLETLNLNQTVIVDAIFGIGIYRSAEGLASKIILKINKSDSREIVAIDLPSGMYCDELNTKNDDIVRADYTLTFHSPKLSFFFPEAGNNTGKIVVFDIGLDKNAADKFTGEYFFISSSSVKNLLPKRQIFTHKGSYGNVHLLTGSKGKMGSSVLMTKGAFSVGAGLVTAIIPKIGLDIMQISVPTAMCEVGGEGDEISKIIEINEKYTYGIGPGTGTSIRTQKVVKQFLKSINKPIVIDADALNIISKDKKLLEVLPKNSILTPHPLEFERLTKKTKNSFEIIEILKEFSTKHQVYVILKDARTIISTPNGALFFSLNGNPGMATGGSGDVLAGMLTGLLAQKLHIDEVVKLGVILHGIAGDIAAKKYSEYNMDALSIVSCVGKAIFVSSISKFDKKN